MSSSIRACIFAFLAVPFLAVGQVNDTYVIPAVADATGGAGTFWSTEIHIFNPQPHSLVLTMVFLPAGGGVGDRFDFEIEPNMTAFAENLLLDVFERRETTGSILIAAFPELNEHIPDEVISRAFLVQSKTFNTTSSGTFGQNIPGVWSGLLDYDYDGISAVAPGVRNFGIPGINGFRTNIGAVNLGRAAVTLRVVVYDSAGAKAGELPFTLPPQGQAQDRLPIAVDHGSVEFFLDDPLQDPTGFVFPYASVVDNRTGDPVYLNPTLLATPGAIFSKAGYSKSGRRLEEKLSVDDVRPLAVSSRHRGTAVLQLMQGKARIQAP